MSEHTETLPVPAGDEPALPVPASPRVAAGHAEHRHPEPRQYVMIAVVLVVVTAIEIAVSYLSKDAVGPNIIIGVLLALAVVKFTLVVANYMHLRTDSKVLRRFFLVGLIGALILYTIVALMLHAFQPSYNHPVTGLIAFR